MNIEAEDARAGSYKNGLSSASREATHVNLIRRNVELGDDALGHVRDSEIVAVALLASWLKPFAHQARE